jgi:hypothetical protein
MTKFGELLGSPYGPADNHTASQFLHIVPHTTNNNNHTCLVAQLSQLSLDLVVNLGSLLGLSELSSDGLLALVVCSTLDLPPLLESIANRLVICKKDRVK